MWLMSDTPAAIFFLAALALGLAVHDVTRQAYMQTPVTANQTPASPD
jgi:hypothetical protein